MLRIAPENNVFSVLNWALYLRTENKTDIEFATGKLSISIDKNNSIHMKGPVSDIKEIKIKLLN